MSFSQHLVLWLHVAFVIFTIGPVTLAIMSTPRYIRHRDIRILRYLTRMTFVFATASLGVLIAGLALASMLGKEGKPWIIVSATLFIVAIVLLGLIHRDQRHAIKALEAESRAGGAAPHAHGDAVAAGSEKAAAGPTEESATAKATDESETTPVQLASVERGRIAMIGGVVSLIWLVILVLMVWNS
jgi:uncharacterized membrane protein